MTEDIAGFHNLEREKVLSASRGQRPRMLLSILQYPGQLPQTKRIIQLPIVLGGRETLGEGMLYLCLLLVRVCLGT